MVELKRKLDTLVAVPKKKYPFPMTTNQEIGWDNDEVKFFYYLNFQVYDKFKPKHGYNKKSCPETKYASDYVTMTKRSPYATRIEK